MTELTMPRLSDSMEQGTILSWLKADGEHVQTGEDLLEIETDKATVTHAAQASGLLQIIAPEGSTLAVGAPIARVTVAVEGAALAPSPVASPPNPEANGGHSAAVAAARVDGAPAASDSALRATPLARRVAKAYDIPLEDVAGSGPLGRVTRSDVLSQAGIAPEHFPAAVPPASRATADRPAASSKGTVEVVEPTRTQALIARRMAEAKTTVPHFQVQTEVAMDAAVGFREQLKLAGASSPSVNDLIVKAAATALREHPLANGSYRDGRFELYSRINIGIAVAGDDALVVPTLFDVDEKRLGTIASESRRLAERVRAGAITPAELDGATFTVSNLGMFGMTSITPVVNPPQSAILGVGALREELARVEGEIVDRRLMTLTLSCDHRILYGAEAAHFLSTIRELLEQPIRLVL